MARGYVSSIDLGLSKIDLRSKPAPSSEEDASDMRSSVGPEPDMNYSALIALNKNVERFQGTVKRIGWAIAFVLLLLVLK